MFRKGFPEIGEFVFVKEDYHGHFPHRKCLGRVVDVYLNGFINDKDSFYDYVVEFCHFTGYDGDTLREPFGIWEIKPLMRR